VAFYAKDNRVLAAAGLEHDREMTAIAELMRLSQMPTPQELKKKQVDLVDRLRSLA